jgi:predicted CXXCH cytochrome family protein
VASHAGQTTVVMPKDRSVVREDKLMVFGRDEPSRKLAVEVRNSAGTQEGGIACDDQGQFKFQLRLQEGVNRIRVGDTPVEVFFSVAGPSPPGFRPLHLHSGGTQQCATCHGADGRVLGGGYPAVCLQCHVIETANPKYRGPLTEERHFKVSGSHCGRCHDPHGEQDMSLLRGTVSELCGQCHGDHGAQADLHGAYGEGSCMACHDAHISGFDKLLIQPVPGVCTSCHDEASEGPGDHPDVLTECTGCHDPHGQAGSGLVRKGLDERCRECHDDVGDGQTVHPALDEGCTVCHHPHREDDRERAAAGCGKCHDLDGEGGVWSRHGGLEIPVALCIRCHLPHAAPGDALVRDGMHEPVAERDCTACHQETAAGALPMEGTTAPCDDCHSILEDLVAEKATLHEPVGESDCTVCHDPHQSPRPALLRSAQPTLCGECHEVPEGAAGSMTHSAAETCSDCHQSHGGRKEQFLVRPPPALCLECHDDPEESGEELHPALEEGCTSCHLPHEGFPPAVLAEPERDLCLGCHDDPAGGAAQVHGAVKAGCSGCHEPHLWRREHLLRADPAELCALCHPFTEPAAGRIVHEPVADCTECHDPVAHGGPNRNFLETAPPELCLNCHDDPAAGGGEVHPALEEGCTACHDPHRGVSPGLLAGDTPAAPCLECHDDPTGGKAEVHPPVEEACSQCHEPHAGDNEALLLRPGSALCLGCHDDPVAGQALVHAPVRESCTRCHDPHAGDNGAFLVRTGNRLCLGCHDVAAHQHSLDAAAGIERFPDSAQVPVEDGIFACTGCHLPHGSMARSLLHDQGELCVACHKI